MTTPARRPLRYPVPIYYTGDMANSEGFGHAVAVMPPHSFGPKQYRIELDDGRGFWIMAGGFRPGPGRRFRLRADYEAERKRKIAAFIAKYGPKGE